jgi:hypothetical protein
LKRLPVYLQAIRRRANDRERDPERDRKRASEIDRLHQRLNTLTAESEVFDDLRWSIEEYALSLYAQSLGTAFPVSAKRIEKKFKDAGEDAIQKSNKATPTKPENKSEPDKPTDADLQSLKSFFS